MATWTTIPNTVLETGKPIRAVDGRALRDNPIAIAEGAAGAPRVEPIAFASGYYTAGAVGTYVFATSTTASDVAFGSTRAGSALWPTSAFSSVSVSGAGGGGTFGSGSALSGTWRCMGYYDYATTWTDSYGNPSGGGRGATLWLRIS